MRMLLTILASITFLLPKAQTHLLPASSNGLLFAPWQPLAFMPMDLNDFNSNQKWQLRSYASVSAGYMFLGSGISYLSAPVGLVLYRPVSRNITGFVNASLTPAVFSIS